MSNQRTEDRTLWDTAFRIEAPEFISFEYFTAGPAIRLFALLLDHVLLILTLSFVMVLLVFFSLIASLDSISGLQGLGLFVFLVLLFVIYWFYFFIQEYFFRGRTLGKIVTGLRVISIDGTSLDFFQILVRNLLRFADMFPVGAALFPSYVVGLCFMFANASSFRRLGDLAAGTLVIRERIRLKSYLKETQITLDDRIRELASSLELRKLPNAVFSRAIHDYALRERRIHPARSEEIARRVEHPIRKVFGAESLDCSARELVLAAHEFLHNYEARSEIHIDSSMSSAPAFRRPAGEKAL